MQRKKNVKRKQPIIQLSKKRKIKCKIKEELRDKKAPPKGTKSPPPPEKNKKKFNFSKKMNFFLIFSIFSKKMNFFLIFFWGWGVGVLGYRGQGNPKKPLMRREIRLFARKIGGQGFVKNYENLGVFFGGI